MKENIPDSKDNDFHLPSTLISMLFELQFELSTLDDSYNDLNDIILNGNTKKDYFLIKNQHSVVKIRCAGSKNIDFLCWGVILLVGWEFGSLEEYENHVWKDRRSFSGTPIKCPVNRQSISQFHNITPLGLKSQLENLLKCKYIIEIEYEPEKYCYENGRYIRTSLTSRKSDIISSSLIVEKDMKFAGKSEKPSTKSEENKPKSTILSIPFFHMVILYQFVKNLVYEGCTSIVSDYRNEYQQNIIDNYENGKLINVGLILDYIVDQCLEDMNNVDNSEEYIMRNLKLAFASIYSNYFHHVFDLDDIL